MQGRRQRCTADRAMVTEGSGAGSLPGEKSHAVRAKGRSEWAPASGEKRKRLLWEVKGPGSQENYGNWRRLEQQNLTEEGRSGGKDKLQSKKREEKIVASITLCARISISFSGMGQLLKLKMLLSYEFLMK